MSEGEAARANLWPLVEGNGGGGGRLRGVLAGLAIGIIGGSACMLAGIRIGYDLAVADHAPVYLPPAEPASPAPDTEHTPSITPIENGGSAPVSTGYARLNPKAPGGECTPLPATFGGVEQQQLIGLHDPEVAGASPAPAISRVDAT